MKILKLTGTLLLSGVLLQNSYSSFKPPAKNNQSMPDGNKKPKKLAKVATIEFQIDSFSNININELDNENLRSYIKLIQLMYYQIRRCDQNPHLKYNSCYQYVQQYTIPVNRYLNQELKKTFMGHEKTETLKKIQILLNDIQKLLNESQREQEIEIQELCNLNFFQLFIELNRLILNEINTSTNTLLHIIKTIAQQNINQLTAVLNLKKPLSILQAFGFQINQTNDRPFQNNDNRPKFINNIPMPPRPIPIQAMETMQKFLQQINGIQTLYIMPRLNMRMPTKEEIQNSHQHMHVTPDHNRIQLHNTIIQSRQEPERHIENFTQQIEKMPGLNQHMREINNSNQNRTPTNIPTTATGTFNRQVERTQRFNSHNSSNPTQNIMPRLNIRMPTREEIQNSYQHMRIIPTHHNTQQRNRLQPSPTHRQHDIIYDRRDEIHAQDTIHNSQENSDTISENTDTISDNQYL